MTILVAGSSGLVGSAIVNKLNKLDHHVIGVSSKDLDLRDRENTIRTIEKIKPKVIIDAAARVGGLNYNSSNPVDFLVDNLRIKFNLEVGWDADFIYDYEDDEEHKDSYDFYLEAFEK